MPKIIIVKAESFDAETLKALEYFRTITLPLCAFIRSVSK